MSEEKVYISIDLKSFYASVECIERNLDPMTTNLVVADKGRTDKTICLAVSPSLREYGLSGRSRLFEVVQRVRNINYERKLKAPMHVFGGSSFNSEELKNNPSLALEYIVAPPRMAYYMEYSTKIYNIYLEYVSSDDMHVYSIDEVFIDATPYLRMNNMMPREFAKLLITNVYEKTGITATAGIGTNLYLCKVAMDIVAKHVEPDRDGVRIAELDELSYRQKLWNHRPLTDFWRIGRGYASKLESKGLYTMGDIARCSLGSDETYYNEDLLYKMFGVNAELLIDHAWGYEPCTIALIKSYKPESSSIVSGQVLSEPYTYEKAKLAVREMAEALSLDLVDKELVTDRIVLSVGYDVENLKNPHINRLYNGEVTFDRYGRRIPKHAHGTSNLEAYTSSTMLLTKAAEELYDRIINKNLLVRRLSIAADRVVHEDNIPGRYEYRQLDIFTDYEKIEREEAERENALKRERKIQKTMLDIKKKHGRNSILKGINLEEGSTARDRNSKIGGHKA